MSEACRVPLIDLLGGVPPDARILIVEDGGMSSHSIPVGRYSAEAAAELRRLSAEVERLTTLWTECAAAAATETRETARLSAEVEALRKAVQWSVNVLEAGDPEGTVLGVLQAALAARPGGEG